MKWTKSQINTLRALANSGFSCAQIADTLKLTFSQVNSALTRYRISTAKSRNLSKTLTNKSSTCKISNSELEELIIQIGKRLVDSYKPIKLEAPKSIKTSGSREEHSILDISDVHLGMINKVFDSATGKQIITYNHPIFLKELQGLQKSIFEIYSLLSHVYRLRHLTIFMLGDLITNDRIFPEQVFEIEKVVGLQIWDAINYFTKFFTNLLRLYEKIDVVCVVGNHGRSTPNLYNEPVENNFEYFIYKVWEKQFADNKRINVIVPSTRFYIHKIYNWKHLLMHGDAMRGSSDSYIERQIKELTLNIGGFDVMHYGHFHKLKEREISDKVIVKQNGCWIERDSYALKVYKTYSVPKQYFFGCNLKRPETWGYKIDLRK